MMDENIYIQENICKSITGKEDENGNYVFEVEASNENLDLQNQITLQSALEDSKDYFLSNGVISDDHLHKTRNDDGSVETHKEKIIGEPISVRKEGKSTFVKGILYKGVEAAKPYIDLLKNKSTRVKASIGGIMPKVHKNADGSETITSFMWNDLALTVSPVNWTVGSAKFAKSISMVDFCKSLNAGYGTNAADYEGGRALQKEDLEKETVKLLEINEGKIDPEKEVIKECVKAIDSGELKTQEEIEDYFIDKGFDEDKAREATLEIIKQGGVKMKKSNFAATMDSLLKSMAKPKDEMYEEEDLYIESDGDETEDEEEDEVKKGKGVKKGCVKKSNVKKSDEEDDEEIDEEEDIDATELVKSMSSEIDILREENNELKKSIDELQESMIAVTKSLGQPMARQSVISKSVNAPTNLHVSNRKPTSADFDEFKTAIVKSAKAGNVNPEQVQFYNSEFQKSMKFGTQAVKPEVWSKICSIVRENR